jgi:hypothetical protein
MKLHFDDFIYGSIDGQLQLLQLLQELSVLRYLQELF